MVFTFYQSCVLELPGQLWRSNCPPSTDQSFCQPEPRSVMMFFRRHTVILMSTALGLQLQHSVSLLWSWQNNNLFSLEALEASMVSLSFPLREGASACSKASPPGRGVCALLLSPTKGLSAFHKILRWFLCTLHLRKTAWDQFEITLILAVSLHDTF